MPRFVSLKLRIYEAHHLVGRGGVNYGGNDGGHGDDGRRCTPLYTCTLVRFDGASGDLPDPTAKDIARLKKALDHGGLTSVTCTRQVKSLTA